MKKGDRVKVVKLHKNWALDFDGDPDSANAMLASVGRIFEVIDVDDDQDQVVLSVRTGLYFFMDELELVEEAE